MDHISWRDDILEDFPERTHRLTLVRDPDGLLVEEEVAAELEKRGYDTLEYGSDPIAFRYAYEREYRSRWQTGEEAFLIVVVDGESAEMDDLPHDLLVAGRHLTFGLTELLPKLDHHVVSSLDVELSTVRLYEAYRQHPPGSHLTSRKTADYVLLHVYGVAPETITSAESLMGFLLKRHYEGWNVPDTINDRLLQRLGSGGRFTDWPLREILPNRQSFLDFVQERWPIFLDRSAKRQELAVKEPQATYETTYSGPNDLPFDDSQMRVYIDNLFIEGLLRPVASPVDEADTGRLTEGWMSYGVEIVRENERRFEGLLDLSRDSVPHDGATHGEWLTFASRWAELTALRNGAEVESDRNEAFLDLRQEVDRAFEIWVRERYGGLHNSSSLAMVHHIPRALARRLPEAGRVALVVVDGLALWQWVVLRETLVHGSPDLRPDEGAVFAWTPTITPVSRQALFAGSPPSYFAQSIGNTSKEKILWRRFWESEGLREGEVAYANLSGDGESGEIEEHINHRTKVVGVIVGKIDSISHGMELGERGMYSQVKQWGEEGYLAGLLGHLEDNGFEIYLTADHGNIEARGIGNPQEGAVAEVRGQRVRVYEDPGQRSKVAAKYPGAIEWSGSGLPKDYLPLLAPERGAFVNGKGRIVGHGGISIEELAVPFVKASA